MKKRAAHIFESTKKRKIKKSRRRKNTKNKKPKSIYDLTEEECIQLLEEIRWKKGVYCPHCGPKENIVKNGYVNKYYQNYICRVCNRSFTVRTGTTFSHSKIPLKMWFIAVISLDQCSISNIAEKIGVSYRRTLDLAKKIRRSVFLMEMKSELFGEFITKVEIDETYVTAGEKGNKNLKRIPRKRGLKAPPGRGTFDKDKPAIVGITERTTGKTMFFVPTELNKAYVVNIFQKHVKDDKVIAYSDELQLYECLDEICQHFTVSHSKGEYVNGDISINNAENRFSLLKNFLRKHRGVSKHNLQEYVTLCQFFINERRDTHNPMCIQVKFLEYIFFAFFHFHLFAGMYGNFQLFYLKIHENN